MRRAVDTAKRRHTSEASSPDARLVAASALQFRWKPTNLEAVLSQFGKLPVAGQRELIGHLIAAHGQFQLREKSIQTITDIQTRKQLRAVETSARRLLSLLGVNVNDIPPREFLKLLGDCSPARFVSLLQGQAGGAQSLLADKRRSVAVAARLRLAIPEVGGRDRDKESDLAQIRAEMKQNADHCDNAIVSLCWIYERAKAVADLGEPKASADHEGTFEPTRRGGARNPPTQKGQVIRDALAMYSDMRERYPDSGNRPGLGPPMRNFVRSVASLFGAEITDTDIDEAWRPPRQRVSKTRNS